MLEDNVTVWQPPHQKVILLGDVNGVRNLPRLEYLELVLEPWVRGPLRWGIFDWRELLRLVRRLPLSLRDNVPV